MHYLCWVAFSLLPGPAAEPVCVSKIGGDFIQHLQWSPDGKKFLFTRSNYGGKMGLWTVNIDGTELTQLLPKATMPQFDGHWAPDSKRIAFSATRDPDLGSSQTAQIYVLDLSDKHVKKLLDSNGPNNRPRWSPDSREIAFVTGHGDPFYYYANTHIAVIPASGGERAQPFLLDRPFGDGRVLMFAVSADRTWSDFPLSPFFLPLLLQCADYGAGVGAKTPFVWATDSLSLSERFPEMKGAPTRACSARPVRSAQRSSRTDGSSCASITSGCSTRCSPARSVAHAGRADLAAASFIDRLAMRSPIRRRGSQARP